jgi:hypothetical protein
MTRPVTHHRLYPKRHIRRQILVAINFQRYPPYHLALYTDLRHKWNSHFAQYIDSTSHTAYYKRHYKIVQNRLEHLYPYAFKNAFLFRLATMLPHLLLRSQPIGSATLVAEKELPLLFHLNARKDHCFLRSFISGGGVSWQPKSTLSRYSYHVLINLV